jgi:hypothetical protein
MPIRSGCSLRAGQLTREPTQFAAARNLRTVAGVGDTLMRWFEQQNSRLTSFLTTTLHALMEGVPLHLSLNEIGAAMAGVSRVRSVHGLHIWTLSSNRTALPAHLVIDDLGQWERVLRDVAHMLDECFDIEHVTLQPETHIRTLERIPVVGDVPGKRQ